MHFLRLLVLALVAQHQRQVVQARQCGWMLFTQHRLTQPECFVDASLPQPISVIRLLTIANPQRAVFRIEQPAQLSWCFVLLL